LDRQVLLLHGAFAGLGRTLSFKSLVVCPRARPEGLCREDQANPCYDVSNPHARTVPDRFSAARLFPWRACAAARQSLAPLALSAWCPGFVLDLAFAEARLARSV